MGNVKEELLFKALIASVSSSRLWVAIVYRWPELVGMVTGAEWGHLEPRRGGDLWNQTAHSPEKAGEAKREGYYIGTAGEAESREATWGRSGTRRGKDSSPVNIHGVAYPGQALRPLSHWMPSGGGQQPSPHLAKEEPKALRGPSFTSTHPEVSGIASSPSSLPTAPGVTAVRKGWRESACAGQREGAGRKEGDSQAVIKAKPPGLSRDGFQEPFLLSTKRCQQISCYGFYNFCFGR